MKIVRPHIPLAVRVAVAERQLTEATECVCTNEWGIPLNTPGLKAPLRQRLDAALWHIARGFKPGAEPRKLELHHRPALENRMRRTVTKLIRGKARQVMIFSPDANDPAHLVYLLKDEEHKIETYVRGQNGQLSDAGLRRKNKKLASNRQSRRKPKHQIKGRSKWPPKGSRPLQGRGFR